MIALHPDDPKQADILKDIRQAFELPDNEWGYEFKLRTQLTEIWLKLFALARPFMKSKEKSYGAVWVFPC